ncbi:MAG: hypothetical protein ACI80V_003237 [Rhodothermales bacterium]|jgi:hypothetical protein
MLPRNIKGLLWVLLLLAAGPVEGLAQDRPEGGREFRRTGIHDGNLVFTRYSNFGNLGSRFEPPKMEWPKGSGQWYGFEFVMMAGAEVQDVNGQFIRIVTENYTNSGSFDVSPDGTHTYGWEPLAGYLNPGSENELDYPPMSHLEASWPDQWPIDYPGEPGSRDGLWNGEFGAFVRGDQESYYVMDDRNNDEFDYFPFTRSSADSSDYPVGLRGLGLQVRVRGYQWVNVQAEDILIVRYDIENVSDKDLTKVVFGMYVDPAVGGQGDSVDDFANFERQDDIVYMWDRDGLDNRGRPGVGYFGFAFLESPGDPLDGEDNDQNGIADEVQDDERGTLITGTENVLSALGSSYDMGQFESFFGSALLRPAVESGVWWTGDEDADWVAFNDLNQNGIREANETLLDDRGSDGLGPNDDGYVGPDSDGSEGNGQPDQGEPNFGKTDNDESDQIGLTSYVLRPAGNVSDDERTWLEMEPNRFGGEMPSNLAFIYGSGYFSLPRFDTRKFAITSLFGRDFDDILRNKRTMQKIYDADYSFAKPPNKSELSVVAGDQTAVLMWDNIAEFSRDPIYGPDFEGYLVYRATDPSFNTIKTITDAFGNPILWKPIAQFDRENGLKGPHPIQIGETGAVFNSGTDSGLRYYYKDTGLDNGRKYYYAVVPYDTGYDLDFFSRGISTLDKLTAIAPTEASKIIQTDLIGNVTFVDKNTAVVVPNAPAAGALLGGISGEVTLEGPATGEVVVEVLVTDSLDAGARYEVTFTDTTKARLTKGIQIREVTSDRTLYESAVFDSLDLSRRLLAGMNFRVYTPEVATPVMQGWTEGSSNLRGEVDLVVSERSVPIPEDVEIQMGAPGVDSSFVQFAFERRIPVDFQVIGVTSGKKYKFILEETGVPDERLSPGDVITMVFDQAGFRFNLGWRFTFTGPVGENPILPESGDVYRLDVSKPFSALDVVSFSTTETSFDSAEAEDAMSNIYVVPDPYVVSASWEKPLFNASGRGERRIDFVNLPPQCTIRIFNIAGKLVQVLEHDTPLENGSESWDLVSKDGLTVSFGVYFFHVDAPDIGEATGKFTLIK